MKFVMILVSMLTTTLGSLATVSDVESQIGRKHEKVADYVEKNVSLFAEKYQEETGEEFLATSVEKRALVNVYDSAATSTYLDFDGNNGYMLIADDYELLDFSTTGQLDWFNYGYEVAYSPEEGYLFLSEQGEYVPFKYIDQYYESLETLEEEEEEEDPIVTIVNEDETEENEEEVLRSSAKYPGTDGRGIILDPDAYINGRYGKHSYNIEIHGDRENARYTPQSNFSVYAYRKKGDFGYLPEGNCTIAAFYTAISSMQKKGKYYYLPQGNIYFNPSRNDNFYWDVFNNPQKYGFDDIIEYNHLLPMLYHKLRTWLKLNAGYKFSGVSIKNGVKAAKEIGRLYGAPDLKPKIHRLWSFANIRNDVKAGEYPVIGTTNHKIYGNHAMTITGCRTYTYKRKVWIFTFTETSNLVTLANNWNDRPVYMDYENDLYNQLIIGELVRF